MSTKARELAELSRTIIDTSDATAITINANEEVTLADDLFLADDKQLVMGDNSEFTLKHHNSGYGQVQNTGTLFIDAEAIDLRTDNSSISSALSLSATNAAVFSGAVTAASLTVTGALIANDVLTVIDGSTSAPSISNAGDSDTGIYFPANDQLGLLVGGSRKVHITSSGVDIENGSLTGGAATFSGSVTSQAIIATNASGTPSTFNGADNNNTLQVLAGTTSNQSFGLLVDAGTSSSDYAAEFRKADNTTIMRIRGDGNVGVGTDSPSFDFVLNRASASATALINSGNNDAMLRLYTSNNVGKWRMIARTDNTLSFENLNSGATAFDTRLKITDSGKVVVGSISGGADGTLAVKTNSSTHAIAIEEASGNEAYQLGVDSSGGLGFFNSGSTTPAVTFSDANKVGIGTSSIDSDSILHLKSIQPNIYFEDTDDSKSWRLEAGSVFKLQNVTTSSEVFRFDQSGHGGIGAAPDTTGFGGTFKYLGVNGGTGLGVFNGQTSSVTAGQEAAAFFGSTTGSSGYKLLGGMQVINEASSSSNAEGAVRFFTATGGSIFERMRINRFGDPIFTGGSSTTLEVRAPTDNAFISLYGGYNDSGAEEAGMIMFQNTTAKWQVANTTANKFRIYNYAASQQALTIDSTSQVGVGTQSAMYATFDVNGSIRYNNSYLDLAANTATVGSNNLSAGQIEFQVSYAGTYASGKTFAFTYEAASWKSFQGEISIAGTGGISVFRFGGYWNNSGHGTVFTMHNAGTDSCAISFPSGQHVRVTITLGSTYVHPVLFVRYVQGGGDGAPRMDRAKVAQG